MSLLRELVGDIWRDMEVHTKPCDVCGAPARRSPRCGAFVCEHCQGNHVGMHCCWCGWSAKGDGGPVHEAEHQGAACPICGGRHQ